MSNEALGTEDYTGRWMIDGKHSSVNFAVKHAMVATVRGAFTDLSGEIVVTEDGGGSVQAEIQVASISTGVEARDGHLQSPDFFDAEAHPLITFTSTGIEAVTESEYKMAGELSVKGIKKPVTLECEFLGAQRDQNGNLRAGFEAVGKMSRQEFGLTWNVALEAGGVLVSDAIKLQLDISAVKVE